MSNATVLGSIVWEALQDGTERELKKEEVNEFYTGFQADVSDKIEKIRSEQRRAYEESKSLILS